MSKRIRTNAKNRVKKELKTFFVGAGDWYLVEVETAEDAIQNFMDRNNYCAEDVDGFEIFEAKGPAKRVQYTSIFVIK